MKPNHGRCCRRPRAEGAGRLGEPVRAAGAGGAAPQGTGLRVRGGGPRRQGRPAPRHQPRPQEGARAPPRRQDGVRVHAHRGVP